jgi:CMP-N,N'-diacetyllegionaminic acid synthase
MINNYNIIGLIPAKKNSKGLKNKNIQKIAGLTLFEIAAINSLKSKLIDEIYVSSDSDKILNLGKKLKIKLFKRKSKYAKSTTDANQVILNFLSVIKKKGELKKTIIIYLQPTSPFRNHIHINNAIKKFIRSKSKSLVSVSEIGEKFYKSLKIKNNKLISYFNEKYLTQNRQSLNKLYSPNGAIYIFYASDFLKKRKIPIHNSDYYIMNAYESLDINSKIDLTIARELKNKLLIYKKLLNKNSTSI